MPSMIPFQRPPVDMQRDMERNRRRVRIERKKIERVKKIERNYR